MASSKSRASNDRTTTPARATRGRARGRGNHTRTPAVEDPTKIRVRLGSCGVLGEGDGVAESGEPFGVVAGETVGVQPLEVVAPEFTIRLAVPQDVVGDDEDAVGDSDDGLLIAAPLDEAAVLGREVGVAFAYGAAGTLDQGLAQGAVGVPSTATQPLARALMVARAEAGPGGRMARRREPRHVAAEFGRDHLGRAAGDAGDGVELGERLGVRRGEGLNLAIARGD